MIVSKVGLDGHTTGAAAVAQALRDAGFEVINLGTRVQPEEIAYAAAQEDVDVVGLSILSGAHVHLTQEVIRHMTRLEVKAGLIVGGTIAHEDAEIMRGFGVDEVFGPGSSLTDITNAVAGLVQRRRAASHP